MTTEDEAKAFIEAATKKLEALVANVDPAGAVAVLVDAARTVTDSPEAVGTPAWATRRIALGIADRIIQRLRDQLATVEALRKAADAAVDA